MSLRDTNMNYDARAREIFGNGPQGSPPRERTAPITGTGGVITDPGARSACEHAAGAQHILITAKEVVHGLLNLKDIRDPERWLKRHRAPVAIDTGHEKRFLAAEVLRWAAEKFAPTDSGRCALLAIANSTHTGGELRPVLAEGEGNSITTSQEE